MTSRDRPIRSCGPCAALLAEAGGTLDDVRQIRTYVLDIETWPQIEQVWRRHWPRRFPASTLVQVGRLFDARQLIETDAIAFIAPDAGPHHARR